MARIVLAVMPFAGHVSPMLGMAAELIDRGHDVVAYTGARYAARFIAVGARWEPWRQAPDFDDAALADTFPAAGTDRGLQGGSPIGERATLRAAVGQARDLLAVAARGPVDAIVADQVAVGGTLAAEILGLPSATVAVVPLLLSSRHLPPPGSRLLPARTTAGRVRDAALRTVARAGDRWLLDPLITAARAELGLAAATRPGLDGLFSEHLVIAQGVPGLDYPRPDLPGHVHHVGRLTPPPSSARSLPPWWPDLAQASAEGRPVVLVSQGTVHVDPDDLIRPAVAGLSGSGVLSVVTTGRDDLTALGPLPDDVRVAPFLPYDLLLPSVDVMVSNGGWSSVLTALGAGIPLVVAGADLDKPEVARRVAWSGAGIDLRTRRPTPARLRTAVEQALGDPGPRQAASRISRDLAAAGGARRAAELVEGLLAGTSHGARHSFAGTASGGL